MVYGILVMVETDDKSTEAPTEQNLVDEIRSNLDSTYWLQQGDIMWFEVHALSPGMRSVLTRIGGKEENRG